MTVPEIDASSLDAAIRSRFGTEMTARTRSIGGGSINRARRIELADGRSIFCKENSVRHKGLFTEEARGLMALRSADGPRVPDVYGYFEDDSSQYLFLEWIEPGRRGADFSRRFGRALATMHAENRSARCGFAHDNHIGATAQKNGWHDDWHTFFAECRIMFQIKLAHQHARLDTSMVRAGESVARRLPTMLPPLDDGGASILHGDLWGGNYLVDASGNPVLIDPAVYFGHREADIAMTELFGGFDGSFYAAYDERWPREPGYRDRRDLYNLYHLLNHLNLFGSSYYSQCAAILRRYS